MTPDDAPSIKGPYTLKQIIAYRENKKKERRDWLEKTHAKSPRCHYCKVTTQLMPQGYCSRTKQEPGMFHATLDHAKPTAKGGADKPYNWRLACFTCNALKADMSERQYIKMLKEEGVL